MNCIVHRQSLLSFGDLSGSYLNLAVTSSMPLPLTRTVNVLVSPSTSFLFSTIRRSSSKLNSKRDADEPVKKALARRGQEGLVRREAGSGYIVRGLSIQDILNLYKVREATRSRGGARGAMPNLSDESLRRMRAALDQADLLVLHG